MSGWGKFGLVLYGAVLWAAPILAWADGAASCRDIRLDSKGESMECVTPQDQAGTDEEGESFDTGACYAYTAAAVYDAWRIGPGAKCPEQSHTSPLYTAALFADEAARKNRRSRWAGIIGGDGGRALEDLMQFGGCPREKLKASLAELLPSLNDKTETAIIHDIEQAYVNEGARQSDSASLADSCDRKKALQQIMPQLESLKEQLGKMPSKNANPQMDLVAALLAYFRYTTPERLRRVVEVLCASIKYHDTGAKLAATTIHHLANVPDASMAEMLRQRFDGKHPQPVGLAFCYRVLRQPGQSYRMNIQGEEPDCNNKSMAHYATIIGRQWNKDKKTCQLLIQNSYKCEGKLAWNCKDGKIWVDQDQLLSNTLSLDYVRQDGLVTVTDKK